MYSILFVYFLEHNMAWWNKEVVFKITKIQLEGDQPFLRGILLKPDV